MLVDDVTAADPSLTQLTQPTDSGNASALSSTLQVMAKLPNSVRTIAELGGIQQGLMLRG